MLTAVLLVQAGINLALLIGLYLVLRGRERTARLALDREVRLESLAADLCAVGQSLLQRAPAGAAASPAAGDPPGAGLEPAREPGRPAAARERTAPRTETPRDERLPASAESPAPAASSQGTQAASIQAPRGDRGPSPTEPSERLRVVAALLDRGLTVADVAAQTAIPEGEIEVFRNLRRSAKRLSAERELAPLRG